MTKWLFRRGLLFLSMLMLSSCSSGAASSQGLSSSAASADTSVNSSSVLIAVFSQSGEQYQVGTVEKGNTMILAEAIQERTGGELFHIERKDPYPTSYSELTKAAQSERGTRPELATDVADFSSYSAVFLGYPIWWGDLPMPVYTFMEAHDWSGKTLYTFNTHAGSGQASTVASIKEATKVDVASSLTILGQDAQEKKEESITKVDEWLDTLGFTEEKKNERAVEREVRRYYQAMQDIDMARLEAMIPDDMVFIHMSGKRQTKEEFLSDVRTERLRYYKITLDNLSVKVDYPEARATFDATLDANAYGAKGVYPFPDSHMDFICENGQWKIKSNADTAK
jgi:flavodoxin/ketosteroid isomerase-like protein